jgi:HEPN domain-containing protein
MKQSFSSAASRHLHDSEILLKEQRWDNAVYLAGYVVECAFKTLVELYLDGNDEATKKFGHNISQLEGKAMDRLRVIYPFLGKELPSSRISGTVLAIDHPERRYAESSLWTKDEAEKSVKRAKEIYQETILKLVLDGLIFSKNTFNE